MADDKLQAAIDSLRAARRTEDSPGLRDVLAIAEAMEHAQSQVEIMGRQILRLADAHAETRRLVDALMGPVVVHGPLEFKSRWTPVEPEANFKHWKGGQIPELDRDPCPLAGQHECRWQLGVRRCVSVDSKPPRVAALEAALREALDLLEINGQRRGAEDDARIAELHKVLDDS